MDTCLTCGRIIYNHQAAISGAAGPTCTCSIPPRIQRPASQHKCMSCDQLRSELENKTYSIVILETRSVCAEQALISTRLERDRLKAGLEEIAKVKYGLELSDYNDPEYTSNYWAKRTISYEAIARKALEG